MNVSMTVPGNFINSCNLFDYLINNLSLYLSLSSTNPKVIPADYLGIFFGYHAYQAKMFPKLIL